ncbi:MAG TPA: hypothetical protein ENH20_00950 [Candidatus Pacearchaeota archaeon]|nr:hypothetical protein [Candidatus Pacearchaeota archaeon]
MNKKFWATAFTLSGTMIGAGILGLPYVFAQSGFLVGLFWLVFLGLILTFVNLTLGEITLRTKGKHQLPGYAKKYLGKWGKYTMFFAIIFGIYSALLAYLIGEGESISKILPGDINPIFIGFFFWIIMTLLLKKGLRNLKKLETWGVLGIIVIIFGIFVKFLPSMETSNLITWNSSNFTNPIGVILFALLGFVAIPELRKEIKGQEKLLKKAIIIGSTIPIILYAIFSSVFVGVLGKNVTEIATLSFGPLITLLGIFTMITSYFALSFSLKNTFRYDLKTSKTTNFIFTSLIPLALYIIIKYFNIANFTLILGIGGIISGSLTGILILLIARKAKSQTRNKKAPEIQMPINWSIILTIFIAFIVGVALELIF